MLLSELQFSIESTFVLAYVFSFATGTHLTSCFNPSLISIFTLVFWSFNDEHFLAWSDYYFENDTPNFSIVTHLLNAKTILIPLYNDKIKWCQSREGVIIE